MALETMTTANKALKEFFLEPARVQLDEGSGPFYAKITKTTENVVGSDIVMPLKYGRSGGVGARAEDGDLPTPSARKWDQARWGTKNIFARIMLTDKLMKSSKSDAGAFADMLKSQMEDIMTDANDNLRREFFGNGTGILATCAAATSVNTITVSSTKYLAEGQIIDICDSTGTVKVQGRTITIRDTVAKTITIDGAAVTTLATDIITISGSYGMELTGLGSIFTVDGTLYGIDRSKNKWFNPYVKGSTGELDELVMQTAIDNADQEMGSKIDFIMCGYGVARAFQYNQLQYKKNLEYQTLKGGYTAMTYNGVPISREKYETDGAMRFLESSDFKLYRVGDWDWMGEDGAILSRVAGKAAYEASLVMYADLGCDRPRAQSLLTGITEH